MEKNKLDKLFQDKFAGREFEFQNKYWEDAEALIEADEQAKKRRMLGWYLGLLFLITISFFCLKWISEKEANLGTKDFENYEKKIGFNKNNVASAEDNDIAEIEKSNGENLPLKNALNQEKEVNNNQKSKAEKTDDLNENLLAEKYESTKNNEIGETKKGTAVDNTEKELIDSKLGIYSDKIESKLKPNNQPTLTTPLVSNEKDDLINNEDKSKFIDKKTSEKVDLTSDTDDGLEDKNVLENLLSPNFLDNKFALLNWDTELNRTLPKSDIDEDKYPLKSHRWQLTATAGIGVIPNPKENDKSLSNFFGGIALGYKITPQIILQSGLNYQIVQADFDRTEVSQQVSYGFGKKDEVTYLQANQMHFLELPILVGYQVGKMRFSAGLKAGKLLAVRGATTIGESKFPWERTGDENDDFNASLIEARANNEPTPVFRTETMGESGWLETANFKAWQFSLVGKYQFQVAPKFDLGLGLEYRFNSDYLKNGQGNHSPLSVQFYTTYRIFN